MTVYIEYVLIDNLVIDYLLLKATFAITGCSCSQTRLFVCAVIGALFALLFPLININGILLGLIKIMFGLILVVIAVGKVSVKKFYVSLVVFLLLTFSVGGAIIGIFSIFNISASSEISIALMMLPVYLLIKGITSVVKFIYRRKTVMTGVVEMEICVLGLTKKCKGFFDTGNGLYDGDSPVIVCEKKFALGLIDNALLKPMKKITVKTAAGSKQMFAIKTQTVKIYNQDKPHIFNNVTLCITDNEIGIGYDVILHPDLLKENNDEKFENSISKVS